MAKINNKLNLNKTPQLVEPNSLIFAKNIKLLSDGTIAPDSSIKRIDGGEFINDVGYIGHIVGLDGVIYIFKANNEGTAKIYEYYENTNIINEINCAWTYNGGKIDGMVTINNTNQLILTICEYDASVDVPIKHINLSECDVNDDETIYTQTPNIPITNLHLSGFDIGTIPNGVYQFFIRYKIKKDFYTPWFPCSSEVHAGYAQEDITVQGTLKHVNPNMDCPQTFKFDVEHLFDTQISKFEEYQLGFILSSADSIVARSWKSFKFDIDKIKFDYDADSIQEINIDDLLKVNFELFNVKNIAYYRNKQYISNYKETDFNPAIDVSNIKVVLRSKNIETDNITNIGNKPLNNVDIIDGIDVYSNWGTDSVNTLLTDSKFVSFLQASVTDNNSVICNVGEAKAKYDNYRYYFNNADVYVLHNWSGSSYINDETIIDDFNITPISNVLEEHFDQNGVSTDNFIPVIDKNTHPLSKYNEFKHRWYWSGGSYNYGWNPGNGWSTLKLFAYGMRGSDSAETQWKTSFLNIIKAKAPNTVITKIESDNTVIYDAGNDPVTSDKLVIKGLFVNSKYLATDEDIKHTALNYIKTKITGLSDNGIFYIGTTPIYSVRITYTDYIYDGTVSYASNNINEINSIISITAKVNEKTAVYSLNVKSSSIHTKTTEVNSKTLMPFTNYDFYIHFVKQNGIVTNGYKIGNVAYNDYTNGDDIQIIYPEITNVVVPTGYVSWFASIYKTNKSVCRGFNHYIKDGYHYIDCLECDALLHNLTKNISIYKNGGTFTEVTNQGEYFSSGNSTVLELFGNAGVIRWPVNIGKEVEIINYKPINTRIDIPIIEGNALGVIHIRIELNDNVNDPIIRYIALDLANKPTDIDVYNYINTKLTEYVNSFAQNDINYLDLNIDVKFKPRYARLGYDFDTLLSEDFGIDNTPFYYTNVDGSWTKLDSNHIIEINEDLYLKNVEEKAIYETKLLEKEKLLVNIETAAIKNAELGITISESGTNEGDYTIKSSREGARLITGGEITDRIVPICTLDGILDPSKPVTYATDDQTCEEGETAVYTNTLSQITPASANQTQIADAIDATQALLQTITINDVNTLKSKINTLTTAINQYLENVETIKDNPDTYVAKYIKNNITTYNYNHKTIFTKTEAIGSISIVIQSKLQSGVNPIRSIASAYTLSENSKDITLKDWESVLARTAKIAKTLDNSYWVVIHDDKSNNENKQLIKLTPYIKSDCTEFNDYTKMNLSGFLCNVKKLDHSINDDLYITGSDVYFKSYENDTLNLSFRDGFLPPISSSNFYIPSEFNLNCLSLREPLNDIIRNYTIITQEYNQETEEYDTKEELNTQMIKCVNSLTCSSVYILRSMYTNITRKTYGEIKKDTFIEFNNTVRSSDINANEVYKDIYTFDAEDYYNIPANRGTITSLFTILDNIFVHTKHAFYKFSGNNTIRTEDSEIYLTPQEVFENGIVALLDSKTGFAGLAEKHHGVVTYNSYIFYDIKSNTIFAFGEQDGISAISNDIQKLLNYYKPNDIVFVADECDDRIYIKLVTDYGTLCLSFSFRGKGFVAIHDLDFTGGFNTRTNTYLYKINDDTKTTNWELHTITDTVDGNYISYGSCYKPSIISIEDMPVSSTGIAQACVDIIYNNYYENIKVLNSIKWIVSNILDYNNSIYMAEENLNNKYPGDFIRIYTDSCSTNLIPLDKIQNNTRLYDNSDINYLKAQTYPRYNNGVWTMNYFKDVKNNDDVFDHGTATPLLNRKYAVDSSLIYGKYFVFRIIFNNTNFKLENVTFNAQLYEKTN